MTKWILILLVTALFSAGALPSRAADGPAEKTAEKPADKKPGREEADKRKEDWKKLSPEEREAKRKEIMARLELRLTELRLKQTNATITPKETRELTRSEEILKRFEQNTPHGEPSKDPQPAAPDKK